MIHRHLDVGVNSVPDELPAAAIVDLLDRGDLDDWRSLAIAVALNPEGPLAETVARLIDSFPMYGTSVLWRAFIERRRAAAQSEREIVEPSRLSELRRRQGVTQTELAERLKISQSDLSKLERRQDSRVSTLRRYIAALGGQLRLTADFSDDRRSVGS